MATRNQVLSMFGATPEQVMERQRQAQAEFMAAQQDPFGQAGAAIGVGLGRLFGGKSEELQRAEQLQQTLQGLDMTDPDQMTQAASVLNQAGFSNEAMQLLARADEFRTSAQDRATAGARQQAAEAEMRRGKFIRAKETRMYDYNGVSVPVEVDVRINRDTQDVELISSEQEMQNKAKAVAQELKRAKDADERAKIIDQIKLKNANNQAKLIDKQMAAADREASETTGLAWVPFTREELDPVTKQLKKVTGHEYKSVTGRMVKGEDGKTSFVPNLQELPEGAKVADPKTGIPEGMSKLDPTKSTLYTIGGTPIVRIGGENYVVHTIQGERYYDTSQPVDAEAMRQEANQLAQQPAPQQQPAATVGTRISNRVTQRPTQTEADRTVGLIQQITGQ